ncbi:MADS-box protein AGL42 isoform X1 [Manihot esculenta]|uniref:Uncharacterized protein n=2 Tax=Manihot esculenta TaxID=3983 RepID=A0A251L5C9_MANES|nr:MADS-box protein AGL42 isoform X1 [Manihot esculenta]XP_021615264.1 MADS-box protein AGL42 isoform X1 [Manihot esculenta]KAG8652846.1 hypothetical protein MANES_06G141600v8 [Manihot esculenta]OAY48219.1 hypothetical protein MANES_06G141600v8 [Manihot esculenta]OAY48221.1 hypothetical protein MANES_06G141600v8 [Manihot esculenta]
MVRGKVQMKMIENATSRQVTFSKRRNGLLKKAYELSVLCDAEVSVLIFSQKGRLSEFSSNDMQKTIERYRKHVEELQPENNDTEQRIQQLISESTEMVKKIEQLEILQRKFLGQELASCSLEELQEMDSKLEKSLSNIRAKKEVMFKEQIEQLKEKERLLLVENAILREKCDEKACPLPTQQKEVSFSSLSSDISEVETRLSIRLPEPVTHLS